MKIFKNICLVSFLIVTILFTVGWASQPIIEISRTNNVNTNDNTNSNTNQNIKNQITIDDLKSENIKKALFYLSIATTLLLGIGIIIGFLGIIGFVFISKIIFFVAMLLMIIVFLIIQINIIFGDVTNILKELNNKNTNGNESVSNGKAYYMILTSMCLMVVTYIVYLFLA